jgi:hypothetical protein
MLQQTSTTLLITVALALQGCGNTNRQTPSTTNLAAVDISSVPLSRTLDLETPEGRTEAYLITRGSLSSEDEIVFYFSGRIYADIPALAEATPELGLRRPLLRFEGFNIARFIETEDGGRRMLSRELMLYEDLDGRVIDCWQNPLTETPVTVAHVWNDPVSFGVGDVAAESLGDTVAFRVEVSINTPSPLAGDDYGVFSASDIYQTTEIFDFFVARNELDDPTVRSARASLAWTRVGQWLPWMQMGQRPGRLIYHALGRKLPGGFAELPEHVRELVMNEDPSYANAPSAEREGPNATSWSRFRDLIDAGRYQERCDP